MHRFHRHGARIPLHVGYESLPGRSGGAARRLARALALACLCSAAACSDDPAEPVISGFSAAASTITAGTSTTLTAVFANGAGTVDHGVGAVSSGVPKSTGALTATTAFTLTVSGEGGTRSSAFTVAVVPAPEQPVITAPSILTAGTTGSASAPDQPGMTLEWTIAGGTFAGGSNTAVGAAVTFTAGDAGTLELTCTAANDAGTRSAPASAATTVAPAPAAPEIEAPAFVTEGASASASVPDQVGMSFEWTITGGSFAGGAATASGTLVSFTAGPAGTLELACTATNLAGASAAAPAPTAVTVAPAPEQPAIAAPSAVTSGAGGTASVPDQAGITFEWTIAGGTFAGGGSTAAGALVTFTAGAPGTLQLTCTAANAAGDRSAAAVAEVAIAPVPVIDDFVATTPAITAGGSATLTATFSGGTGTVDHGVGTVSSGVAVDTGALWDTTTFVLTVTNAAGDSASREVTVRLVIVFTTEGEGFSPVLVVDGAPAILWTFADGTTSTSRTPQKAFDGPGTRLTTLTVTPWSAVRRINVGYVLADGASPSIETVPSQHVSAVEGLGAVRSTLAQWCSAHNEVVSLDFADFTNLDTIDCYQCTQLASVNLANTPRLSRLSLEAAVLLGALDVSQSPALTDLRAALTSCSTVEFGDAPLPDLWHVCVRDNPQITDRALFASTARFPVLASLLVWNSNQAGELRIAASHPTMDFELEADDNAYTSVDLEGALSNPLALGVVSLDRNPVASLNLTGCVQITELSLQRTALGEAEQDGILATLDALGRVRAGPDDPATLLVDLRENVSPSAAGRASAANLASKGWTVVTNDWTEAPPPP